MEIRFAEEKDIPAIVALLKVSLGETRMPKSEAYWRWKHVNNPFGPSPVMVAEDKGAVIAVRAFMPWCWRQGSRTFQALRAVDTAVHPGHQGKGLFTQLTLSLIDECKKRDFDLIYNTPNTKSMPGYLKMGWVLHGRLPICFYPVLRLTSNTPAHMTALEVINRFDNTPNVTDGDERIMTPLNQAFLRWRYTQVPHVDYHGWADPLRKHLVIYRQKKSDYYHETRLVHLLSSEPASLPEQWPLFLSQIPLRAGLHVFTMASSIPSFFPQPRFTLPVGPVCTLRKVADSMDLNSFAVKWQPSLGDMELF